MIEALLFSAYGVLSSVFILKFQGHRLQLVPFLHFVLFLISSLYFYAFHDGLLVGMPDQLGYVDFGSQFQDRSWHEVGSLTASPNYWFLSSAFFSWGITPVASLRFLNFMVHLVGVLYAYETIKLLTKSERRSIIGAYVIALSPTFLGFDLYVVRDALMVYLFIVAFYYTTHFYLVHDPVKKIKSFLMVVLIAVIEYYFRKQLGFTILLLLLLVAVKPLIPRRLIIIIPLFFVAAYLAPAAVPSGTPPFSYLKPILTSMFEGTQLWDYTWKFLLYSTGFSFLDPTAEKTFSLAGAVMQRVLAIDSIVFMLAFMLMLFTGKLKLHRKLVNSTFICYLIYSVIYLYFNEFQGGIGLNFRVLLPFFYTSVVFVISNSQLSLFMKNDRRPLHIAANESTPSY